MNTKLLHAIVALAAAALVWGHAGHAVQQQVDWLKCPLVASALVFADAWYTTWLPVLVATAATWFVARRYRPTVFLVDFVAHKPDDSWKQSRRDMEMSGVRRQDTVSRENFDFQRKVLWNSGLGPVTYMPPWLGKNVPPVTSMEAARAEYDHVIVEAASALFEKTGVSPSQIGAVVVNCSLFCPTPSLASRIMHHFKMSSSTVSYNLGGMGCSASPIALDLARQFLELRPNTYVLVASTEVITPNYYIGNQRGMLVPNMLFRAGGAVMLLTNKTSESWRAKYKLQHIVRTSLMADDVAYHCAHELEDSEGLRGIKLSRDLPKIAGKALRENLSRLGPKILPLSEQLAFAANLVSRTLLGNKQLKPYVPNFQKAAQHICIHTGGRGVIDAIQKELRLSDDFVEPSRAALWSYGNTSSSSLWYVLSYIEQFRGLRRGDKVLQLAFGTGFKCNSTVWVANKTFKQQHPAWERFNIENMHEDVRTLQEEFAKGAEECELLLAQYAPSVKAT